jgi:hypothetical protein
VKVVTTDWYALYVDIQTVMQGVRSNLSFTKSELPRLANTFTKSVWNGSSEDPHFRYYLDAGDSTYDATRGHWGFGFLYLAEYDYRIRQSLAAYFERYMDIMQQEPYIAVTAAMLACAAQAHDRWSPGPPRLHKASVADNDVRISWQPPAGDSGGARLTGLQGYLVYRAKKPDGPFEKLTREPLRANEFVDAGVGGANSYYRVTAVDYCRPPNEGPASEIVASGSTACEPGAPSEFRNAIRRVRDR